MSDTEATDVKEPGPDDGIAAILALADREEEIEQLRRVLVFSIGMSCGLIIALNLVLRNRGGG
jgi:hypothetical protein